MSRKITLTAVIVLLSLVVGLAACAGTTAAPPENTTPLPTVPSNSTSSTSTPPSGPIKATWIDPQVNGSSVSIPLSEVEENWNTHFKLEISDGTFNFMSYILDGTTYVRANVCPPCRSIGYSLFEGVLVCDRCATTFEADSGNGIDGACVDFPKASVAYEIIDGNIVMSEADLVNAYQHTLEPGLP